MRKEYDFSKAKRNPYAKILMTPQLIDARHVRNYKVWLKFSDGTEGEIDLGNELWGEVFEPLKDLNQFRQLQIHPELKTLTWPGGADFAPEFLYEKLRPSKSIKTTASSG